MSDKKAPTHAETLGEIRYQTMHLVELFKLMGQDENAGNAGTALTLSEIGARLAQEQIDRLQVIEDAMHRAAATA